MSELIKSVKTVAQAWQDSPYYASAEQWTHLFWNNDTVFRRMFDQLNLSNAVELACGHGRHAERCAYLCGTLTLVDIFPAHLDKCRERFAGKSNVLSSWATAMTLPASLMHRSLPFIRTMPWFTLPPTS